MTVATAETTVHTTGIEGQVSGAVLRLFRHNAGTGYQQEGFAEAVGVDINTYRSWEHGRRPLSRLPVYKLKALCRALAVAGVPRSLVGALDVAIEVDIDVVRALSSEENLLPPDGCSDTWMALMQWTLGGWPPLMFRGMRRLEAPRICPQDQRILMHRLGWELGG